MRINKNIAIIETNPGVGGEEARLWARELLASYIKYAQRKGITSTFIDHNTAKLKGNGVFSIFSKETGVHRVQRIPKTEKRGRVHTSTAVVLVLPQINPEDIDIKNSDLEWSFFRSGGHGGQNVNKVSTAVRLRHIKTGIVVTCSQERYQGANRQLAIQLLAAKLYQLEKEKQKGLRFSYVKNVGTGDRAEKIRTYNFPQNRLTDHRLGKSFHNLTDIIDQGRWEKIFQLGVPK